MKKAYKFYGSAAAVYNFHSLCHVTDDFREFGALDNISAFKYENQLGKLKKLVRSGNLPLSQLAKRLGELNAITKFREDEKMSSSGIKVNGGVLKPDQLKNSYAITNKGDFFRVIKQTGSSLDVLMLECRDLFKYPLPSTNVGIAVVKSSTPKTICISDLDSKCMCVPRYNGSRLIIKLLHS